MMIIGITQRINCGFLWWWGWWPAKRRFCLTDWYSWHELMISIPRKDKLFFLVKRYGIEFKQTLVYDRIKQHLREFCANNTIDDVYNTSSLFLDDLDDVDVMFVCLLMFFTKLRFWSLQHVLPFDEWFGWCRIVDVLLVMLIFITKTPLKVNNRKFLEIVAQVKSNVQASISELGEVRVFL